MPTDFDERHRFVAVVALGLSISLAAWLFITMLLATVAEAQAGAARAEAAQEYVAAEIIVGYRSEATAEEKARLESSYTLTLRRDFPHIRARHYRLPAGVTVEDAVRALQSSPIVEYAEPNYLLRLQALPTDPRFPEQWYLHNTGQSANEALVTGHRPLFWNQGSTRSGCGFRDLDHPELINRFWINARDPFPLNNLDDDGNGFTDDAIGRDFYDGDIVPLDANGHGSLVASLIAAERDNGEGGAGVSPTARVMALRVASDFGLLGTSDKTIAAFTYAALRGARIINASFGGLEYSASLQSTIQWLNDKGVLLVAAAGNGGGDDIGDDNDVTPVYPASYPMPNVISVAATNRTGELARFSNYGAASVHIAAPGVDIFGASVHRTTTFQEDFAAGAPDWTTGVTPLSFYNVPWTIHTDATGRRWAIDSNGTYLPNVDSWLMSPQITTGVGTQLSYRRWLVLNWGDCFWLEISTNNGGRGISYQALLRHAGRSTGTPSGRLTCPSMIYRSPGSAFDSLPIHSWNGMVSIWIG